MAMTEVIEQAENVILHTYNRFPVVFDRQRVSIFMIRKARNILILPRASVCLPLAIIIKATQRL